jgi:ribonuclease J
MSAPTLEFLALGGLGEFGKNLTAYRFGEECIVVDAGMGFPSASEPGVDFVLPQLGALERFGKVLALIATHGHEDHIGGIPHFLKRFPVPVWGSPYTLKLIQHRLAETDPNHTHQLQELPLSPQRTAIGPFEVESIRTAHSIPDSRMLLLHSELGCIVHSADFKLDPSPPDGEAVDEARLREIGREGVLLLVSDSTNADRPGRTAGESSVVEPLDELFSTATGRLIVTSFASNVQRVATIADLAHKHGKRLALLGSSVRRHAELAQAMGRLSIAPSVMIHSDRLNSLPPQQAVVIASGSQGEPRAALHRLAHNAHRDLTLERGDRLLHSARSIPGNERSIGNLFNRMLEIGVEVIDSSHSSIHVSGHGAAEELAELIRWVRPAHLLPVHGEYRQQLAHRRIAIEEGLDASQITIPQNGDRIALDGDSVERVSTMQSGSILVEREGGVVSPETVAQRRHAGRDGVISLVVEINADGSLANGYPDVAARGFQPACGTDGELDEMTDAVQRALRVTFAEWPRGEVRDIATITERVESGVRRAMRATFQRSPLIVAIVQTLPERRYR